MSVNDTDYGSSFITPSIGHVSQQANPLLQTTVTHTNVFLEQPAHVSTQSDAISQVDLASVDSPFVDYGAVHNMPQAFLYYSPAHMSSSINHISDQFSINNDVSFAGTTGPLIPTDGLSTSCGWVISEDWSICGQTITELTVPKHLREHGIRDMHKDHVIQCRWLGCEANIKRQGITRHAREVHMGVKRKSGRHTFA